MADIIFGDIPQGNGQDLPIGRSSLGTPVYQRIIFEAGSYSTNVQGVTKSWTQLAYDAAVVVVTQAKKIIRTQIQGKDGTVPEYIGMDDYNIQITGIITGENGRHPADEIIALKKMLDAPVPVKVSCTYLTNLGITDIIVENYEIGQQAGGYSYQTFVINCFSFTPQELRLSDV